MLGAAKNAVGAMGNMKKLQDQQAKFQAILASVRVSGSSKNGKVIVVLSGDQKMQDIKIDPTLIAFVYENFTSVNKEDTIMSKAIKEAVEDAITKVQGEVVKKIQETGSMSEIMGMLGQVGGM